MTCPHCGSDAPAGMNFCGACGQRLTPGCPACGFENLPGFKFCGQCGASLVESQRPALSRVEGSKVESSEFHPSTLRPFGSSTSAGERRQLTVLFCDLVGSTEIASRMDPEEWSDVAARYQRTAAEAATRFGGHVAKYLGDGLVVYFGYPQTYDDAAERAVRAGLSLVQAVGAIGSLSLRERDRVRGSDAMPLPTIPHPNPLPEGPEGEGVELHVRIGIHTVPILLVYTARPEFRAPWPLRAGGDRVSPSRPHRVGRTAR